MISLREHKTIKMIKIISKSLLVLVLGLSVFSCKEEDPIPETTEDKSSDKDDTKDDVTNNDDTQDCQTKAWIQSGTWSIVGEDDLCENGIYNWGSTILTVDCGEDFGEIELEYSISSDCKTYNSDGFIGEKVEFNILESNENTFRIKSTNGVSDYTYAKQ